MVYHNRVARGRRVCSETQRLLRVSTVISLTRLKNAPDTKLRGATKRPRIGMGISDSNRSILVKYPRKLSDEEARNVLGDVTATYFENIELKSQLFSTSSTSRSECEMVELPNRIDLFRQEMISRMTETTAGIGRLSPICRRTCWPSAARAISISLKR